MENRKTIATELKKDDKKIGCYDKSIDGFSKHSMKKLIDGIGYGDSTDVHLNLNRKKYVVEVAYVDDEVDFNVISKADYDNLYGN